MLRKKGMSPPLFFLKTEFFYRVQYIEPYIQKKYINMFQSATIAEKIDSEFEKQCMLSYYNTVTEYKNNLKILSILNILLNVV